MKKKKANRITNINTAPIKCALSFIAAILCLFIHGDIDIIETILYIIVVLVSIPILLFIKTRIKPQRQKKLSNKKKSENSFPRQEIPELPKLPRNSSSLKKLKNEDKNPANNKSPANNKNPVANKSPVNSKSPVISKSQDTGRSQREAFSRRRSMDSVTVTLIFENNSYSPLDKKVTLNSTVGELEEGIRDEFNIKDEIVIKPEAAGDRQIRLDSSQTLGGILRDESDSLFYIEIIPSKSDKEEKPKPKRPMPALAPTIEDSHDLTAKKTARRSQSCKKGSLKKFVPTTSEVEEPEGSETDVDDFAEFDKEFVFQHSELNFLNDVKIEFKFSSELNVDNYSNSFDDENTTIEEIKALISGHLSEVTKRNFEQKRICLVYKGKKLESGAFLKDIDYKAGDCIDVSILSKTYFIQFDKKTIVEIDLDDIDHPTVKDIENKIYLPKGYCLKLREKILKSDQKLEDLSISKDRFVVVRIPTSEPTEKVTFILYSKNEKVDEISFDYSNKKNISDYKKELGISSHVDLVFFSQGKVLSDRDVPSGIVNVYPRSKTDTENNFNKTANSVKKYEKPKIENIIVRNMDQYNSDDELKNQIVIEYDDRKGPKKIFDLKKIVANKLGILNTNEDVEKISLFILFQCDSSTNFTLLFDNDDIDNAFSLSSNSCFYFDFVKGGKDIRPNFMKNYRKQAKDLGLEITDADIKKIYEKAGGNMDIILTTFSYISYNMKT